MAYLGSWKIDDLLTFPANTHRFDTGAGTDADAVPDFRIYEDETGTPILTGSMALLDGSNTVGFYTEQITLSAANGFEKGKCYTIYIVATVNSVTATMSHTFQIEAEVDANRVNWANVDGPTTTVNLSGTTVKAVTDRVTANVDQLGGVAQSLTDLKDFADDGYDPATNKVQGVVLTDTLITYTGNTPQTGDSFARLGAPAGGSVSADILVIDNFVDDLETRLTAARAGYLDNLSAGAVALQASVDDLEGRLGTPSNLGSGATVAANLVDIEAQTDDIGTAGAGLTAIPWNASWDAEVESEATDALNAYDPPTRTELTSDTNSILSAVSTISGFIDTEITTILNRLGAFTGTGVNTVLGFFQALMRKDATTPTDLGGAYDDATDSLEAIRDRGDSAWLTATGFSTLNQADVRTAVGLASANLDTQLSTLALQTSVDDLEGRLTAARAGYLDNLNVGGNVASAASIAALNNLSAAQVWAAATRTLTASLDPNAAAIVTQLLATTIEGRTFEEILKDVWATTVGDAVADDATNPTLNTYEGPDGATQVTHTITPTTRVRS